MFHKIRIGDAAKHHGISKQTLIHYDRIGLLKPSIIEENQYRYYTVDDLDKLDLILNLKDAGVTLKGIQAYLDNPSLDESLDLLKHQNTVLEAHIQKLQQTQVKIAHKIKSIESVKNINFDKLIRLIEFDERYILTEPIKGPIDNINLFGDALKRLNQRVLENETYIQYAHDVEGVSIDTSGFKNNDFEMAINAFFFIDDYTGKKNEAKLPKGLYLSYYHHGLYSETYKSYGKLLNYIQDHHLKIMGNALEIPLITAWSVKSESEYITEIQIPVSYL